MKQPVAVILGSEDTGISKACLDLADQVVGIPVKGQIESLNVSVAAGVVLYEAIRQRYDAVVDLRRRGELSLPSSIGEERRSNLFMRAASAEELGRLRRHKDQWRAA